MGVVNESLNKVELLHLKWAVFWSGGKCKIQNKNAPAVIVAGPN